MSIVDRLSQVPGTYWGDGNGPHSGPFVARITIRPAAAGSVALDYEAWAQDAGLQHAERALIQRDETGQVILRSVLEGQSEALTFQEGQPGVFGSLDGQQVGVVIDVRDGTLSWAWWWSTDTQPLREQSRAVVRRLLEPEPVAPLPAEPVAAADPADTVDPVDTVDPSDTVETVDAAGSADPAGPADAAGAETEEAGPAEPAGPPPPEPVLAPWPGVLVLTGMGGVAALARDLAARAPSAAIVRGDLLARAISGTEVTTPDGSGDGLEWRARLAARLTREYAELGHAVVLADLESSGESGTQTLLEELDRIGVGPVRLLIVDENSTADDVLAELPRRGRRRSG
jgi:hypothetical protein